MTATRNDPPDGEADTNFHPSAVFPLRVLMSEYFQLREENPRYGLDCRRNCNCIPASLYYDLCERPICLVATR